ncbi:hypothetical protein GCM10023194_71440 [Planotetraspora phitsanulokensis]|uniref:Uncharacterized protein n=1 Tax=Planotetraspora phitsanulokensis TaxID=575192 RepID=A0A8J3XDI9_9ACTN|nr:hypothetical protein [Planotetraspora phitsanulokensis]GII37357.1 hypothetical protein Pph01_23600 [Planotetraspora phitsanulokensis]
MPKLKNVMAGLAISTALAGGAIALGATSASAATTGWDNDRHCFQDEDFTNFTVGAGKAFVNFSEFDKDCHKFDNNRWDR